MDSLITAAALALAAGDVLGALQRVALRDDPPALALRGIAMAQLGEFARAKELLRKAARAFGPREAVARARCVAAEAEIALASRDLVRSPAALRAARATLEAHGDRINAAHAQQLEVRWLLLTGHVHEAARALDAIDPSGLPPAMGAVHELLTADIAMRRLRANELRAALERARTAAMRARIPALLAEAEKAFRILEQPVGRLIARAGERALSFAEVEAVLSSNDLVIDAWRHEVRQGRTRVELARRPVLFGIARTLAEAWPDDVPREDLLARVFGAKRINESHRVRLRVEMGRLRRVLEELADIRATARGFALSPQLAAREVVVLARATDAEDTVVLALLSDGESWSTSSLALALGRSQRTLQRTLGTLAAAGKVQSVGSARARRWMASPLAGMAGFTPPLLLPVRLPID
ncbi:helix-turn-helix domain-containing protein [Pendulispora rubella]|uniref:Helix-turn-helix domain-containing protein n=1 Tax=Pendulispora rubella TaxID=2741070 RepID=A0ABZ2KSX2_9BACT